MKFEKLNEDKIRIILNVDDLKARNIDFHSFMSQSIETQELFLNMLDEAEQKCGFITRNHKLMIEALAINEGDFILTVTRIESPQDIEKIHKPNVKFKRKTSDLNITPVIYSFNSFDDFTAFCSLLHSRESRKLRKYN